MFKAFEFCLPTEAAKSLPARNGFTRSNMIFACSSNATASTSADHARRVRLADRAEVKNHESILLPVCGRLECSLLGSFFVGKHKTVVERQSTSPRF